MKFSIMDASGHSEECYTADELLRAEKRFQELLLEGRTPAVRKGEGGEYAVSRKFDPTATEVLFVPQLKGG